MTVVAGFFKILCLILITSSLVVTSNELDNNFDSSKCSLGNSTGHKIFFYLYTNRQNRSHYENVTEFEDVTNSSFNSHWKTIFLIHGWKNDITSPMIQLVKDGYLNLSDYNVIGVDWSYGANNGYPISASCVYLVADWIGMFIKYLIEPQNGLNVALEKINLVGHSLGAHIAGIVGEYFRIVEDCKTIPVIVGLDPAGPNFVLQNMYSRLDLHDASYVEVIHTSKTYFGLYSLSQLIGLRPLGMPENIGDVDIYPNYGGFQPLCKNLFERFLGICAHSQAYHYFAYSLNATKHDAAIAVECEGGLDDIAKLKCSPNNNTFYYMGDPEARMHLSKSKQASNFGVYYFETGDIEGWWENCEYYFLMILACLLPPAVVLGLLTFCIWALIYGFKLAGYQCQRIDAEGCDNDEESLSEDQESPLLPE